MAHLRKQIRDQVITTLTGLATTGTNVFRSRVYNNEASKLPCLCVYTLSENIEDATLSPVKYERALELAVEGYAKATSNIDDTLDQIALEVEEALAADLTLNSLALDCALQSTEINLISDGDQPIGAIRLSFEIHYRTRADDVETSG